MKRSALPLVLGVLGLGSEVLELELLASSAEVPREIERAVIGHDAPDLYAQACVIGHRCLEEGNGAGFPLVFHDLAEGDASCVVDTDMDKLPPNAEVTVDHAGLSSRDPMAHRADPPQLLDIDMDELARLLPLIAADGLRLQSAQFAQAQPTQNAADSGRRDADLGRDLLTRPALTAQLTNFFNDVFWRRSTQPMWSRAAVTKPDETCGAVPGHPFANGPRADACG